jgi:hypothetical protein
VRDAEGDVEADAEGHVGADSDAGGGVADGDALVPLATS